MRHVISLSALLVIVLYAPSLSAQAAGPASARTWLPCPRCQSAEERTQARQKYGVDGKPFNPHDISGIWGNNGVELNLVVPPFTPKGKEMYDATRAEETADGVALSNSRDPMLICDPLGYPRWFAYNYGFQFVVLPDRVMQFFELGHTWRDIWTDGRTLPDDPPQPRWLGYAVGRWEGDTFVVESNGYDDRSWITEDRRDRRWGFPHSDQMRVIERYGRTSFGTLDAELTVIDPVVFTKPWTTHSVIQLSAGTELGEYMCVPSENEAFNAQKIRPQVTGRPVAAGPVQMPHYDEPADIADLPMLGRWRINVAKSTQNGSRANSDTFTWIFKVEGNKIRHDIYDVYPADKPSRSYAVVLNGSEANDPHEVGIGETISWWPISRSMMYREVKQNGKVTQHTIYSVSPNGKVFTSQSWSPTNPNRRGMSNLMYFERQE